MNNVSVGDFAIIIYTYSMNLFNISTEIVVKMNKFNLN